MTMQRTLISAAIAAGFALAAGQAGAQALTSVQMAAVPAANTLFISGATAPQQTLIDTIETNLCGGTFTRLRSTAGNSARYQGWGCTSAGSQIAVYYTTLGSNWGVQPVLFAGAGRNTPRIDPTACATTAGVNRDNCTVNGIAPAIPDVGVSDVRPSAFISPNLPTQAQLISEFPEMTSGGAPTAAYAPVFAAIASPYTGGGSIEGVQGVVFGIAVNNTLGALLQTAQSLPVVPNVRDNRAPAIAKNVVVGMLSGSLPDADSIDAALGIDTATLPGPTRYVVCRRAPTSGTQTWANVYWLRNGTFPDADLTVAPAGDTTDWAGKDVAYVQNTTGGNVRACVNRATSSGVPAIGIISAENDNNAGASPSGVANTWSFAKLDGIPMETTTTNPVTQASNLTNAKLGTYDNVGEVTLNRRGALAGVKGTLYTTLRDNLRGAAVCTTGAAVSTGALQIAGIGSNSTCKTVWSRGGNPFTTARRQP
jgi:hypothetical protein